MRKRPLSRILRASALSAMALMMAAPAMAVEPPCKQGRSGECAIGSSLLDKVPYFGRLFKNLGVAGPTECEQAIGVDFEVSVTRDGVISIQEIPITRCMFSTNACPNGKCATGIVTCSATEECSETAPGYCPLTTPGTGECPLTKLEAAVSTGCCATSKSCCEVAKECCTGAKACFATALATCCSKSNECCAKQTAREVSKTACCASLKDACCATAKSDCCSTAKDACCGASKQECCSTSKSSCCAATDSACCSLKNKCEVACSKPGDCCKVKTTCESSRNCCATQTTCGQGDCCDQTASHVAGHHSGHPAATAWARARQHCPVFSMGGHPGECPIHAVRLQSKINDLEMLVEVQQHLSDEKERWMDQVQDMQREAASLQTQVLGSYMEMVVETMEARAEMMEELSNQKLEMMEQLATVHVENAKLQAKLEGAEQTLEMMHAIAKLQMENEQLKQQVAGVRVRGRNRNEQPVSAPSVDPRCPVTGTSTTISTPASSAPRQLNGVTHPTTTRAAIAYPTAIAAPSTQVIQTAGQLPAETYLVCIRVCEGDFTTGEIKKVHCEPRIMASAGRDFECISGGEIINKGDGRSILVGTAIEGCVRRGSETSVHAEFKVSTRSGCGDSENIVCVQELATEVSGNVTLGEPIRLKLGGQSGQEKWLTLTIDEAR